MDKFLFAFQGGKMPESQEEGAKIMEKWGVWMQGLGDAMADPGSIVGPAQTVSPSGVAGDASPTPMSGYMVVYAPDQDAAVEIAKGCPILSNEGTVNVAPLMTV